MNEIKRPVGTIKFDNKLLTVYDSLDEPLFRASDIADTIGYTVNNLSAMLELCEDDEKVNSKIFTGGQRRNVTLITLTGLYNILAQSRKPIANQFRKRLSDDLVRARKDGGKNIIEWFNYLNNN